LVFKETGVNLLNAEAIASYLKHILRCYHAHSNVSEIDVSNRDFFTLESVYDLIESIINPHSDLDRFLGSDACSIFTKNYSSESEHWVDHKNAWNVKKTGSQNLSLINEFLKYDGRSSLLGIWKGDETISGSRDFKCTIPGNSAWKFWDSKLMRSISYENSNSFKQINGFTSTRFYPRASTFQNATILPDNSRFYMSGPSGMMNMDAFCGYPIWYSLPHFLNSDYLYSDVFDSNSFDPSFERHYSYADIDSVTGVVLKHANRYQINVRIDKMSWFSEGGYEGLFDKRDYIFAPVLWFEETYEPESEFSSELFGLTYEVLYIGSIMTLVFAILGILLCIISCIILHTTRRISKSSAQAVHPVVKANI
jgi:hypothetical protein